MLYLQRVSVFMVYWWTLETRTGCFLVTKHGMKCMNLLAFYTLPPISKILGGTCMNLSKAKTFATQHYELYWTKRVVHEAHGKSANVGFKIFGKFWLSFGSSLDDCSATTYLIGLLTYSVLVSASHFTDVSTQVELLENFLAAFSTSVLDPRKVSLSDPQDSKSYIDPPSSDQTFATHWNPGFFIGRDYLLGSSHTKGSSMVRVNHRVTHLRGPSNLVTIRSAKRKKRRSFCAKIHSR